jgi:hypothetical protein
MHESLQRSNCDDQRWASISAVVWTPTGKTRCEDHALQNEERNDCGALRWTVTDKRCGYHPSIELKTCNTNVGWAFSEYDDKDPLATVKIVLGCGVGSESAYIYPNPAPYCTVKCVGCDGTVIGYALNGVSGAAIFTVPQAA